MNRLTTHDLQQMPIQLAPGGRPFPTKDSAQAMRMELAKATGQSYRIVAAADGYVLIRRRLDGATEQKIEPITRRVLHPALRTEIPKILLIVGALWVASESTLLSQRLALFLSPLLPTTRATATTAAALICWLAFAVAAWLFLPAVYRYFAWSYVIGPREICQRNGLLARTCRQIRLVDIRSIGLQQSLFERLLNVGTLEFSTAGTDGAEVCFADIANPTKLKAQIQAARTRADTEFQRERSESE